MKPSPPTREDKLQLVFAFLVVYSVLLFAIRPEPTPAQVRFRAGIMLVGVIGLGVVSWRKRRR